MASESPPASRRRTSTRSKEKSTERVENTEDTEKSKKKYESRTHILENKMREWDELLDDDLWNSFHTKFAEWINEDFKLASITIQKKFRAFLRSRDVWVMKSTTQTIAKSLAQVVKRDISTPWTEEEIRSCMNSKTFVSSIIINLVKTDFERNSKNYSWQALSQSGSKRSIKPRLQSIEPRLQSVEPRIRSIEPLMQPTQESPPRGRSVQQKPVTREMQQSSIRPFHQLSIRQPPRESSIARNFLRQPPSSPPQPKIREIPEILQNLYIDSSSENLYSGSSSENPYSGPSSPPENAYVRYSEKESMPRQSFQPRFSKFYQSPQLPEQFYRRSTEYSSLVSSSSSVPPRSFISKSFASSSSSSSVNQSIKSSNYGRELINLAKLYSDEAKYSEENDNLSFKLIMFNDMCDRVDVSFETKLKAFSTMLKELALDYYYANMTSKNKNRSIIFDDVCVSMMNYFEDAEYKRSILNKWNNLSLKSVMNRAENERKSMNECLQLLIKELRHLQHDLESILRIDDFIHNKLVNACQKISACQYACFKSSEILTELINDLKSSIIIYQKAHFIEFSFLIEFIFFTDRRYHRNFSSRINQDRENREFQNRESNRGYQNRRNQKRTEKKCFVC